MLFMLPFCIPKLKHIYTYTKVKIQVYGKASRPKRSQCILLNVIQKPS